VGSLRYSGRLTWNQDAYRKQMDNYIIPGVGSILCREMSVGVAEGFLQNIREKNGPSLAKTVRTVLSNICAFAARLDAMDRNPVPTAPHLICHQRPARDPPYPRARGEALSSYPARKFVGRKRGFCPR
jgi:hypothetical protein